MGPAGHSLRDTTLSFLVNWGQRLHNFHPPNTVYWQNIGLTEMAPRNAGMHFEGKWRTFSKYLCTEPLMVPIIRDISTTSGACQH